MFEAPPRSRARILFIPSARFFQSPVVSASNVPKVSNSCFNSFVEVTYEYVGLDAASTAHGSAGWKSAPIPEVEVAEGNVGSLRQ